MPLPGVLKGHEVRCGRSICDSRLEFCHGTGASQQCGSCPVYELSQDEAEKALFEAKCEHYVKFRMAQFSARRSPLNPQIGPYGSIPAGPNTGAWSAEEKHTLLFLTKVHLCTTGILLALIVFLVGSKVKRLRRARNSFRFKLASNMEANVEGPEPKVSLKETKRARKKERELDAISSICQGNSLHPSSVATAASHQTRTPQTQPSKQSENFLMLPRPPVTVGGPLQPEQRAFFPQKKKKKETSSLVSSSIRPERLPSSLSPNVSSFGGSGRRPAPYHHCSLNFGEDSPVDYTLDADVEDSDDDDRQFRINV